MKYIKHITLLIVVFFTFSITSCFEESKKPTYDELVEEHDSNKSEEFFGMIVVGAIFCFIVYRSMKNQK